MPLHISTGGTHWKDPKTPSTLLLNIRLLADFRTRMLRTDVTTGEPFYKARGDMMTQWSNMKRHCDWILNLRSRTLISGGYRRLKVTKQEQLSNSKRLLLSIRYLPTHTLNGDFN